MLRALLRHGRKSLRTRDDPHLRDAFDAWARPWMAFFLALTASIYGGVILLAFWPLDLVLVSDPHQRAAFASLRISNSIVCALCLLVLTQRRARKHIARIAGLFVLAITVCGAWNAAALPHDPFYWPGTFAPLAASCMLVPVGRRIVWTVAAGVGHNVVWYARNPAALSAPETPASLGLYGMAIVMGGTIGHVVYLFAWQMFRAQREIRQSTEDLALFNQRLESDVREKTSEVQRLARRLESLHEDERRRLASELHDELGQTLTALRLEAAMLQKGADPLASAESLHMQLDELFESVRWIVSSLRPKALEERGLVSGCEWLIERFEMRTDVPVRATLEDLAPIGASESLTIFRVLQEALTNVARHAEAAHVAVSLSREGDSVILCVDDDGNGFDAQAPTEGHGVLAMRERALAVGADLAITPLSPGARIHLRVRVASPVLAAEQTEDLAS